MNPANSHLEHRPHRQSAWRDIAPDLPGLGGSANSARHHPAGLPTGFAALDAALTQEGWPPGTCIEVLSDSCGMGAMGLFLPAMESLTGQGRWQAFVAPPFTPYAPLLKARGVDIGQVLLVHPHSRAQRLASIERALLSSTCSVVFGWLGAGDYQPGELQRLEAAAAAGDTLAVLFRATSAANSATPAGLRLQMSGYRQVHIVQQRAGRAGLDICLSDDDDLPQQPQLWELPAAL
ncbi:translesion DNA synthesis-associated protein ImuA [Parahaliea mediterranea]|uniref:translesion DNA synthesis-associated protein ImuA n=1 Tax=Parahaliea mediterranea TaxID=651086 RepID=UPI000E2F70D4|nr:translesion DNA synthesis-associated protein ImuA [Parahaliea mediterranea]